MRNNFCQKISRMMEGDWTPRRVSCYGLQMWFRCHVILVIGFFLLRAALADGLPPPQVVGLWVDGRPVSLGVPEAGHAPAIRIPSGYVRIEFGARAKDQGRARRFRCKLEGLDGDWSEAREPMRLVMVFSDEHDNWLSEVSFPARGESPGWRGTVGNSSLVSRNELVRVPERARTCFVVLSSAGPAAVVGTMAIGALTVSLSGKGVESKPLLEMIDSDPVAGALGIPHGWHRSGTRPNMAHVVESLTVPPGKLLAVIDEDDKAHAEWQSPRISIGDAVGKFLRVEWLQCFSIGYAETTSAVVFGSLEPGRYVFRINELSLSGQRTEVESSQVLIVVAPFWNRAWFLVLCGMVAGALGLGAFRYYSWRRTRRELAAMRQQEALAQERMRIARDLHDDLGSTLTQILMLAQAMEDEGPVTQDEVRTLLKQIHGSALAMTVSMDEIVWALSPKNDRLDHLVAYLIAYAQTFLGNAKVGFRSTRSDGLSDTTVPSPVRHHLFLSFKEALANAVRHAKCRTVFVSFVRDKDELLLTVKDDGAGFDPAGLTEPGNGLENMRQRMAEVQGEYRVDSRPGAGTSVQFRIPLAGLSS